MKSPLLMLIKAYQKLISPFLGPRCRFYPSCSEFALQSLNKYRLDDALKKIGLRLLKCHPFHSGGVDLP